jgi:trans-aconitate methyltransferase
MTREKEGLRAFRSSAEYYEVLFDSAARLEREGPYLRSALERAPGRRVVDLACGTGPHALFFAEQGAEVTALDLSTEMIAHAAARRPHPAITYRAGDMRRPEGGPWDLAVCLGNSLCLLPTREEAALALGRWREHLAPGGLLLVQILNYAAAPMQEPSHRVVEKTSEQRQVVAVKSLVPHRDQTLLSLSFYAFSGAESVSVAESAVLLHLSREDLETLGDRAGFRTIEIYGGFDRRTYEPETSADLVVLLEKV